MGYSAQEPNAHDVHMYKGAVKGRADSILRTPEASALGNRVQSMLSLSITLLVICIMTESLKVDGQYQKHIYTKSVCLVRHITGSSPPPSSSYPQ